MKIHAIAEKPGAYELRRAGSVLGGIVVNAKNRGIGFIADAKENQYLFDFEDGILSKSVKIFRKTRSDLLGTVKLGFTDSGVLEIDGGVYTWTVFNSSKAWFDSEQNVVVFVDLENNAAVSPQVLVADSLDPNVRDLLLLCGWYLLVVEWRAGFTNAVLAGAPVKIEGSERADAGPKLERNGDDWFDVLVDAVDAVIN